MAVRCASCDRTFQTQEMLEVHMRDDHDAEGGRSDSDGVNLSSGGETTSDDAMAVGERFPCPQCGAEMSSRDSLDTHLHDAHAA